MNELTTDYQVEKVAAEAESKDENDKPMRQQKALLQKWKQRIEFGRKHDDDYRKRWADDRKWAAGDVDWLVRANLIGAIMEVLAAFLYARNPDIKVSPSQSVNRKRIEDYRDYASTLTIIASRLMKDAGMKRKAKQWVRQSMTVGIGWMKATMQTRTEKNPLVEEELHDLQSNLQNIQVLERQLSEGTELGLDEQQELSKRAEIESNMKALEANLEMMVAEGLVLGCMAPEDVVVAPDCGDVENYLDAPFIALDYYRTKFEAEKVVDWDEEEISKKMRYANLYKKRPRDGEHSQADDRNQHPNFYSSPEGGSNDPGSSDDGAETMDGFVRITEIWCKDEGVVYTMIDGINDCWARQPYAPVTGKRFYPVFSLPCHLIDGERYPQGDVYQLKELQEEYNRARSNFAEHRERSVPGIIFNKASVNDRSVDDISKSARQEIIGIELTSPDIDIRSVFTPKAYAAVDMNLYDTRQITQEMEKISGAQDALQSSVQVEKTATEAKIQEAGFGARSGSRRDTLEDALTEMSEYIVQLAIQTFTQAEAEAYAGPQAIWVEMTTEEAMMMFNIDVKAGSTGKPKANEDREMWAILLPLIERLIDRIGQARVMGQEWAAKPWIAVLDETMHRLDDPGEITKFLPVPPPPEPPKPDEAAEADVAKDQAEAENKRADTLKLFTEMGVQIPEEIAMNYFLVGGKGLAGEGQQEQQQPMPQQQPALEEAPNPIG